MSKAPPDFSRVDSSAGLRLCVGKVSRFNWLMFRDENRLN